MLSIFGIPKPFRGHLEVIQRNAIRSWTLLHPECQVILAGNEYGTREVAEEFGVCHVPDVAVNEYGTPLENSVLQLAEQAARHRLMCLVASDIILMSDVTRAVEQVACSREKFVMFSQRWNLKVTEPITFDASWEDEIRAMLTLRGQLYVRTGMDYMVYPRGLLGEVPPFAVGRRGYDHWLLYRARTRGADLVDATQVVKAVHQDHDYSHHPDGAQGIMYGTEAKRNVDLAGSWPYRFIIKDRTHVLTTKGLKRSRDLWRLWRILRTAEALHPSLLPPFLWFLKAVNSAIDVARNLYWLPRLRLGITAPHERTTSNRRSF